MFHARIEVTCITRAQTLCNSEADSPSAGLRLRQGLQPTAGPTPGFQRGDLFGREGRLEEIARLLEAPKHVEDEAQAIG